MYDDNSSVTLNSLTEFLHYREIRPIASCGARLTWVYLIQFKDKSSPEKQQVDLAFNARYGEEIFNATPFALGFVRSGHITLRISHSARTWGADLESLLAGHVLTMIKQSPRFHRFVDKHSGLIGLVAGAISFLFLVSGILLAASRFTSDQVTAAKSAITFSLPRKVDFITQRLAQGDWTRFTLLATIAIVAGCILSVSLGVWVSSAAENHPKSFVLLSRKAIDDREIELHNQKRHWLLFFVSLIITILASLAANGITLWLASLLSR